MATASPFTLGGAALPPALAAAARAVCEQAAVTPDQLDCKWEAWALTNAKSTGTPSESEFRAFAAHLRAAQSATKPKSSPRRRDALLHTPTPTPTLIRSVDEFFNYCEQEHVANDEPLVVRDLADALEHDASAAKRSRVLKHEPLPVPVKPRVAPLPPIAPHAAQRALPGDDQADEHYANRDASGRVEASLDNSNATPHHPMAADVRGAVDVQPVAVAAQRNGEYMNNPVRQRINDVRAHMQTVLQHILSRVRLLRGDDVPPLSSTGLLEGSPATVLIAGRIRTELEDADATSTARINVQSVILENEDGNRIKLNLNRLVENKHPFFINPGMIVVVEGVNTNGRLFDVHAIYDNAMHTPQQQPRVSEPEHPVKMEDEQDIQPSQPYANLIVAAGPFTRPSNLKYEPLSDLLEIIERNRPDVVILTGPFVEESHQHISDRTPMSHEQVFVDRVISPLQAAISSMVRSGETVPQFVLIPALGDVHHSFVCPQPAFRWPLEQRDPNIHLCPNPSVLRVSAKDGQHVSYVGISSLPTLLDISADSVCMNKQDRLGSIVSHMLRQRSFYPSFPPSNSVPLDTGFLDQLGIMDVDTGETVDMIIMPSKLKAFAKSVDGGAVAVNPGLASRESNGGTYAEIALPLHHSRRRRSIQANEDKIEVRVIRL
ncbi:DNA polymerase alpha subunit B [Gracilaria domingensis]|nr:DNA polymerase alpha subunit B [Gracilaria domingensis]